jgi:predicted dienelactone hydrolase
MTVLLACVPDAAGRQVEMPADVVFLPGQSGPFLVHKRELGEGRGFLYLASTDTTRPDPRLFPRPLVVFTPGFSAEESGYERSARYLASHGFFVLGANHDFNFVSAALCATQKDGFDRVSESLSMVKDLSTTDNELKGFWNEKLGTLGHSYGGKLALWRALDDERVVAAAAWDPVAGDDGRRPGWCPAAPDGFPRLKDLAPEASLVPTVVFSAGMAGDCAPESDNAFSILRDLNGEIWHAALPGAAHQHFVDAAVDEDCYGCGLCPAGDEDPSDVLRLSRSVAVAHFKIHLDGDERYAPYLKTHGSRSLWIEPPEFDLHEP